MKLLFTLILLAGFGFWMTKEIQHEQELQTQLDETKKTLDETQKQMQAIQQMEQRQQQAQQAQQGRGYPQSGYQQSGGQLEQWANPLNARPRSSGATQHN